MDTRTKILTIEEAHRLPRPVAIASGTFNPVRAAEADALAGFRKQIGAAKLLVVIRPAAPELLPAAARAQLAAALRVVDHVVVGAAEELIRDLRPAAVLHLPDFTPGLSEHVRLRSSAGGSSPIEEGNGQ